MERRSATLIQPDLAHPLILANTMPMKITEDISKPAAERSVREEDVLFRGMEERSKDFVEAEAEVYAKA
jgi:hypothetical protein